MSGREWVPGDVAMVTWEEESGRSTLESTEVALRADCYWTWADGLIDDRMVTAARPLVVIDPEDMAAVERLQDCYIAAENKGLSGLSMQAALREFANPTPPKPDEPQGLGAVVVDANDVLWIRVDGEYSNGPWFVPGGASCRVYDDVDVVKVLSSGYEQGVGEPLADWERDFLEVES